MKIRPGRIFMLEDQLNRTADEAGDRDDPQECGGAEASFSRQIRVGCGGNMGRKKVWESASDRATASRKRREAIDGVKALKLMQFSLTLANKFILEDLREAWGYTGSEVVAKLLKEAESRYRKEIRTVQEKRREAQKCVW